MPTLNQPFDDLLQQAVMLLQKPPYQLASAAELLAERSAQGQPQPFKWVVLGAAQPCQRWIDALLGLERPAQWPIRLFRYGAEPTLTLVNGAGDRQLLPWPLPADAAAPATPVTDAQLALHHSLLEAVELVDLGGATDEVASGLRAQYLPHAGAFIFVTNATQVFPQWEREQMAALLGSRPAHQAHFVVMNMHQIEAEDEAELRDWVQQVLAPYFVDEKGQAAETAYARQVHFVNPRQEESVAQMRAAFAAFLADGAARTRAQQSATVQVLVYLAGEAEATVATRQTALHTEIAGQQDELRRQASIAQNARRRQAEFGEQMALLCERCQFKVYESLVRHVEQMERRWPQEGAALLADDVLTAARLTAAALSAQAQERLSKAVEQKVTAYLDKQVNVWAAQIPDLLAATIADSQAGLAGELSLPAETMQQVQRWLHQMPSHAVDQAAVSKMVQQGAKQWLGIGGGELGLVRLSTRVVLLAVAALGPLLVIRLTSLLAVVIFEAAQVNRSQRNTKESISTQVGESLFRTMRTEIPAQVQPMLATAIERQFALATQEITRTIQRETDETQQQAAESMAQTEAQLRESEAALAQLEQAQAELKRLVSFASEAVYGKPLMPDEIASLYPRKAAVYAV